MITQRNWKVWEAVLECGFPDPIGQAFYRCLEGTDGSGVEVFYEPDSQYPQESRKSVRARKRSLVHLPDGSPWECTPEALTVIYFYWLSYAVNGGSTIVHDSARAGMVRVRSMGSDQYIDIDRDGRVRARAGSDQLDWIDAADSARDLLENVLSAAVNDGDWFKVLSQGPRVKPDPNDQRTILHCRVSSTGITQIPADVVRDMNLGETRGVMWVDARVYTPMAEVFGEGVYLLCSDKKFSELFFDDAVQEVPKVPDNGSTLSLCLSCEQEPAEIGLLCGSCQRRVTTPTGVSRIPAQASESPWMCAHANEVPWVCPCSQLCVCRQTQCMIKDQT